MNYSRADKPIIKQDKRSSHPIKLYQCISKVSIPNLSIATPAQKVLITSILKWGER